jgi:hypothetical protein
MTYRDLQSILSGTGTSWYMYLVPYKLKLSSEHVKSVNVTDTVIDVEAGAKWTSFRFI